MEGNVRFFTAQVFVAVDVSAPSLDICNSKRLKKKLTSAYKAHVEATCFVLGKFTARCLLVSQNQSLLIPYLQLSVGCSPNKKFTSNKLGPGIPLIGVMIR